MSAKRHITIWGGVVAVIVAIGVKLRCTGSVYGLAHANRRRGRRARRRRRRRRRLVDADAHPGIICTVVRRRQPVVVEVDRLVGNVASRTGHAGQVSRLEPRGGLPLARVPLVVQAALVLVQLLDALAFIDALLAVARRAIDNAARRRGKGPVGGPLAGPDGR